MAPAEKLEPYFDVEEAVKRWGMVVCEANARTRKQKKLYKRHFVNDEMVFDVQIDWSHLSIKHETKWGDLVDGDFKKTEQANGTREGATGPEISKSLKPVGPSGADANVLFETDFKNDTGSPQAYTLKIEKTTRSTCMTEIEHGVTNGVELNATLSIGDVLEVGTGFSHEVSLNKIEGETLETEVNWGAESTVSVAPHKKATAQMQVIEKQQSGDFTVFTQMDGYVTIKYISLKDDSIVFGHSGKIKTIVKDYVKQMKGESKYFKGVEHIDDKVQFQTKGRCRFRYGVKQVVTIVEADK